MNEISSLNSRVIVVGAINVDVVVATSVLPGPGETVVGAKVEYFGGGKGANAAIAASRAGAKVTLIGAVGSDETGTSALAELHADGIDTSHVTVLDETATGVALIVVDDNGENQIAVGAGANAALTPNRVRTTLESVITECGCVLVSTEVPDEVVVAAVATAIEHGVVCVLNPAPVTQGVFDSLDAGPILTPNQHEAVDLGGAAKVAEKTGSAVVVTRGADGVDVVTPGSPEVQRVKTAAPKVVDTTGAGDTFNGVLAAYLAAGANLTEAVEAGVTAATLSVGSIGARSGMPDTAALRAAIEQR